MRMKLVRMAAVLLMAGCSTKEIPPAAVDAERPWRKPGDKIDSILPMEELIRRFQVDAPEVAEFEGGEASREALARRFLLAVSQSDSTTVDRLLLTRSEFAWLFFPDHLYAREPYALDPDIFWLQLTQETRKGRGRLFSRYGGRSLSYLGLAGCQRDTLQVLRGPDTVWTGCRLRYRADDSTLTRTLFGSVIQREGRFKFLSYHTEF